MKGWLLSLRKKYAGFKSSLDWTNRDFVEGTTEQLSMYVFALGLGYSWILAGAGFRSVKLLLIILSIILYVLWIQLLRIHDSNPSASNETKVDLLKKAIPVTNHAWLKHVFTGMCLKKYSIDCFNLALPIVRICALLSVFVLAAACIMAYTPNLENPDALLLLGIIAIITWIVHVRAGRVTYFIEGVFSAIILMPLTPFIIALNIIIGDAYISFVPIALFASASLGIIRTFNRS